MKKMCVYYDCDPELVEVVKYLNEAFDKLEKRIKKLEERI